MAERQSGAASEDGPEESAAETAERRPRGMSMDQQAAWVDLQVRRAIERGDFDDLPGAGRPIPGLGTTHDPDWWLKGLVAREQISGVLPPSLALRKEHEDLDERLDRERTEHAVRRVVADFNARVLAARRRPADGPPVTTPVIDADQAVEAWQSRRERRD